MSDGIPEKACEEEEVPGRVHDSWFWVRDTKGYGSVTVTLLLVAFLITTLAYVASMFESIGPVRLRPFDVAATSVYFVPILSLYFGRKFTEAKYQTNEPPR